MINTQTTLADNEVEPGHSTLSAISAWKPLLVFILFTLAVTASGAVVFHRYKETIRTEKQHELGGIAELKIRQIQAWLTERRGDAQALQNDPLFTSAVAYWLQRGGPPGETRTRLAARLSSMQQAYAAYGYISISLFDERGMLRLSSAADEAPLQGMEKAHLIESMRTGQIAFSDIHRGKHRAGESIEINLVTPLAPAENGKARSIGAVFFRIDPHRFIFPLIQRWPTPSTSAENLLVRRDGDEVVFLNELRHRKNPPLEMRLPLLPQLPAAMAAMGREGLIEGLDYRGVPVVGMLGKIPGTSWAMVSKIDKAEIYAPINQLAGWMLLLMLSLTGAGGGVAFLWWKKEKKRYENEIDHQRLAKHLDYLAKYANDIILLIDRQGNIADFNDRALEAYGYSAQELKNLNIADLRATSLTTSIADRLEEINSADSLRFESTHVRHNGERFPVEVSVRAFNIAGEKFHQSIIRDITERMAAEQEQQRLNRALRLLSACNSVIVHSAEEEEEEALLLSETCKLIVETGNFRMAWVGFAEHDPQKTVRPVAQFGNDDDYLKCANISWADTELGRGPTGAAIRTGVAQVNQDFLTNPLLTPWRETALARGYLSSIALPLKNRTQIFGTLTIYSAALHAFNPDEVILLQELADNLGWGITALRTRTERKQAVEQLRNSEEHFRFLTENATDMIYLMSMPDGRYDYVSPSSIHLTGYTPEEFYRSPKLMQTIMHPDWSGHYKEQWEKLPTGEIPAYFEFQIVNKSGETRWMHQRNAPLWIGEEQKKLVAIQGVVIDITERKLAEARLESERTRLRTLVQTIPDLIWLKDPDGIYLSCNVQFERFFGAKEADIVGKTDYDFVDKELADFFRQNDRAAMSAGKPSINEEWITYSDNGQRALLETIKTPMRDDTGKLIGVMGIARDITERKQAEEREGRLHHILDSTLDMIFIFRPDSLRFVYINRGALDSIGYSNEELLLMTPPDITPLLPETQFRKLVAPLVAGEKNMLRFETMHRSKSGTELPVEVQLQLVQERRESLFVAVVRDITERRLAEKELHKQKRFMWQVIDTDPNQISVKDDQGTVLLANQSAAAAHGLTPVEMVGRNLAAINRSPEEIISALETDRKVIESGREINLIEPYTLQNGQRRWFLTIKKRLVTPSEKLSVLCVSADITQQKLSVNKLAESYKKLQQLALHLDNVRAEERARIALNLHDEMGATLAATKMSIAWLASKLPADTPQLSAEADHLTELVSAAIQTMRQTVTQLNPPLLDDLGLITAIQDYVKKFQQHTKIACTLVLPDGELALATNQTATIFRILQESLNNVVKHAQASEVHILLKKRSKSLLLTIEDNGRGLKPDRNKQQSFGLLGIRERALMVGGKARIKSRPGNGTQVSVSLPLAPQEEFGFE